MKVLIYSNKEKDKDKISLKKLINTLQDNSIDYEVLCDDDLNKNYQADALFSLGGDGTILFLTEFVSKLNIPIIGINTGKLGFLTEFERDEIEVAVNMFKQNALTIDNRVTIKIDYNNKTHYALNDVFVRHVYTENISNIINDISVKFNDKDILTLKGDGIIVSTPTGSTAYSLSAGGPILSPELSAFVLTPIAAHTLTQRPIVFPSEKSCKIGIIGCAKAGVYVDGKAIGILSKGDFIDIKKSDVLLCFLRRKNYDFYNVVTKKLNNNSCKE